MHPILFSFGSFELRSYTVFAALGAWLAFWFLRRRRAEMGVFREEPFWVLVNLCLVSMFVFARLTYLATDAPPGSLNFWSSLFAINSGFSVFGFVGGMFAGVYAFCRLYRLDYLKAVDLFSVALPLWLATARIGCFLTGCCYGSPAPPGLPWAVIFTHPASDMPLEWRGMPLHPAQIYEAVGDLLLAALLYGGVLRGIRRGRLPKGSAAAAYLAGYGILRIVLERFRGDTVPGIGPWTMGQVLSLGLCLVALGLFWVIFHRAKATRDPPLA